MMNKRLTLSTSIIVFIFLLIFFLRSKKISERGIKAEWELELRAVVIKMTKKEGNKNYDLFLSDSSLYHVRFFDLNAQIDVGDSIVKYRDSFRYAIYKNNNDSVIMDTDPNYPFYIKKPNSKNNNLSK